jgi:hypothetical protein
MSTPKRQPKIYLTPLRGKLKLKDVERAIAQVKAARAAQEKAVRGKSLRRCDE